MNKVAYRGNGTIERGELIIRALESAGGNNWGAGGKYKNFDGSSRGGYYYITENGLIYCSAELPRGYHVVEEIPEVKSIKVESIWEF